MCLSRSKLTVLFEDPFWVGLYERESEGRYEVCRIVFGAEPSDQVVYQYLMDHWRELPFSPSLEAERQMERRVNPKRQQREARKQTQSGTFSGTKAQQALKLQREQGKLARQNRSRERRKAETARKRELLDAKRKEKHKGH